ncbi:hypothetical protein K2173_013073 [Erythroxylum novogranatense]|uniref:Uncharacterized protein n=1 Tax=Erythroxylum novogranatense TaxID=1862640 RepID=A0AAV8S5U4_9ROSI|nr:hypothetical protein K2173_013073 [Erythroxylum novogranatense]
MDSTLPVARRTRQREVEWFKKRHEEIKRNRQDRRGNAGQSPGSGGLNGGKEIRFNGSGADCRHNLGIGDDVQQVACNSQSVSSDDLGCSDYGEVGGTSSEVSGDSDDEVVLVGESENVVEKDVISIDDIGNDHEVGLNGSVVGESDGLNVKTESMENGCSNFGKRRIDRDESSGIAGRTGLQSSMQEKSEDADGCDISEDNWEASKTSCSDDVVEQNDFVDDEDYVGKKSESTILEEVSRGKEEVDEKEVRKQEISEVELEGKLVSGVDSNSCGNVGFHKKVDCGCRPRQFDCVAKRTRSHFYIEFAKKKVKLGTASHPLSFEEEEHETTSDDGENVDVDNSYSSDATYTPKKGITKSQKVNGMSKHVEDLCGGKPTKRKCIRTLAEHEILKILLDSVLDKVEVPFEDKNEPPSKPTLPLKFTFSNEESIPLETSEEEKELAKLWDEMASALFENDATDNILVENETNISSDSLFDTNTSCGRGDHQIILDEEVGLKCKFCPFVKLEIKFCVPSFGKNPWGKSEGRGYGLMQQNIFDELNHKDSELDCQPGSHPCAPTQGTVWDIIPGIGRDMHAHQLDGFEFLWKNIAGGIYLDKLEKSNTFSGGSGCVISHAPGTGKTRLAIAFIQTYMKLYPTCMPIIIAPRGMLLTWETEFQKWNVDIPFHNLKKRELSGKENEEAVSILEEIKNDHKRRLYIRVVKLLSWMKDSSILGLSYRLFEEIAGERRENKSKVWKKNEDWMREVLLTRPGLVVLDEGHTARNETSSIWKTLSSIKTEKRIILSGTPFQNNFDELFNTLSLTGPKFLDKVSSKCHKPFPSRRNHKRSDTKSKWDSLTSRILNARNLNARNDKAKVDSVEKFKGLIEPFVHVHRGDILQQRLPGLRDSVVILQPHGHQKRLLDAIEGIRDSCQSAFNHEYAVSVVSVHPSLLPKRFETRALIPDQDKLESLKLNTDVGVKTKFLVELMRHSQARNEKVLVFSQFISPLKLIRKQLRSRFNWIKGRDILYMNGKLDIDKRQSLMKDFNDSKSESKVLLASTRACSEGINLVGASRVILLDVVWNPAVERQAISRAYRLGQKKIVYIYHLLASGTMEEEKYCRQVEKERISELVFYSADRDRANGHQSISSDMPDDNKDCILEEMVNRDSLKNMFKKIIYQPKDSHLVKSFAW